MKGEQWLEAPSPNATRVTLASRLADLNVSMLVAQSKLNGHIAMRSWKDAYACADHLDLIVDAYESVSAQLASVSS